MYLQGLARLGRDIEIRYLTDGTPVGGLALAFSYGKKGQDGNRPTQWVEASIWGERAEKLQAYLTKGTQISVILSEPHIETFARRDGSEGTKLVAKVLELQFAGGQPQEGQQRQDQRPAQRPDQQQRPAQRQAPASSGFNGMDDDSIPF
jgi:single-strand DNA-binding protein